jgi:hypothetical protein
MNNKPTAKPTSLSLIEFQKKIEAVTEQRQSLIKMLGEIQAMIISLINKASVFSHSIDARRIKQEIKTDIAETSIIKDLLKKYYKTGIVDDDEQSQLLEYFR